MELCGRRVAVVGLGVSNRPLIDFLLKKGACVTGRDRVPRENFGALADAWEQKGVRLVCGDGYLDGLDEEIIFRAPGIRPDHPAFLAAMARGAILTSEMELDGYTILPVEAVIISTDETGTLLKMTLREGRNRQIRKMCEQVGLTVKRLCRVSVGSVKLEGLPVGKWRYLTEKEVDSLYADTKH